MTHRRDRGFSTIEAMAAMSILAIVVASLAHSINAATQARASSARIMQATSGAMSVIEQLRNGDLEIPPGENGFVYEWSLVALAEQPGLARFAVTVKWEDNGPRDLRLEGLSWSRR